MTFKTADELEIHEWEREGLVETLEMLEGEAPPLPDDVEVAYRGELDKPRDPKFSMCAASAEYQCGTALCVGGWVYLLGKPDDHSAFREPGKVQINKSLDRTIYAYVWEARSEPLQPLYFPHDRLDYARLTAQDAARAVRGFLEGRGAEWPEETDE